jgi:hypothetical protein
MLALQWRFFRQSKKGQHWSLAHRLPRLALAA